jgi:membrane-bound lytic murein transglycosylase B
MTKTISRARLLPALGNLMLRQFLLCAVVVSCVTVQAVPEEQESLNGFRDWLQGVEREALERGISKDVITSAFRDLAPDARVIGFDRNQPEFVQTFEQYLTARVSDARIEQGNQLYRQYGPQLQRVGQHYGVDPRYIVAFWGLESSFGRYQGKYSVIRSLATLAYDPRRSAFFRKELLNALQILEEGHVSVDDFVGGWAGAMGQNQFIPSSFLNYAQDFDGDGRKNIWTNNVDVWASIANYLQKNGWRSDQGWGMKVSIPAGYRQQLLELKPEKVSSRCRALKHHTRKLSIADWQALQVRTDKGGDLPAVAFPAALIIPEDDQQYTYMTFPNFRTILSYNCANKYAVSVGLMADAID